MRLFFFYLWLQMKKSVRMMCKTVLSMICVVGTVCICCALLGNLLQKHNYFDKITVGIVITDDSEESEVLLRLVYAMESVNGICRFDFIDADEAESRLLHADVHAVIVITPDFYDDVNTGVNTPVQILLGKEKGIETSIFYELLLNGCELIRITEGAIYATTDVMHIYETNMSIHDMQDLFTKLYVENILRRYDAFEEIVLSPTGELNYTQYYYVTIACVLILMLGLNFTSLYKSNEMDIVRLLKREGLSVTRVTIAKVLVMSSQVWLTLIVWYGLSCLLCYFADTTFLIWNVFTVIILMPVAISMATYFHLIYSWCKDSSKSGMLLFILNVLMLMISGAFIPTSYMPQWVEPVREFMPLTMWWQYISAALFGNMELGELIKMMVITLLFGGLGVLGICKRQ